MSPTPGVCTTCFQSDPPPRPVPLSASQKKKARVKEKIAKLEQELGLLYQELEAVNKEIKATVSVKLAKIP